MKTETAPRFRAVEEYRRVFRGDPDVVVFAPGRVNLIGEHTDYNDGFVLPFALPLRTFVVGSKAPAEQKETRVFSCNIAEPTSSPISFIVDSNLEPGAPSWLNYFKGVVYQYLEELPRNVAMNAVVCSDIPLGSGLSSSAAFEVAVATFLEELYEITSVSPIQKSLRCQKAEHSFAHVPCGIMDQFISAMGKKNNLLLIDCRDKAATLVPFGSTADAPVLLICNSNVHHDLSGSEYPDRVKQCKRAVSVLRERFPEVHALRDATIEMLESCRADLDEVVYRRAHHVITENERTVQAANALQRNDFATVGRLMNASHESLSRDYNVSCSELDALQALALSVTGVYGSRMTGGGFGGCTVTLVAPEALKTLREHLEASYEKMFGRACTCYEASPDDGASRVNRPSADSAAFKKEVTTCLVNEEEQRPALIGQWVQATRQWLLPIAVMALAAFVGWKAKSSNIES